MGAVATTCPRYIPGIYLFHAFSSFRYMTGIYQGYLFRVCNSKPGIFLVYTRPGVMPAHLKSCHPSCSKIAVGMPRHTGVGLQGCLMFITARGAPTGHPSARAWTLAPGAAYPCRETQPSPSPPGPLSAATARAGTATAVATATARAGGGGGGRGDWQDLRSS